MTHYPQAFLDYVAGSDPEPVAYAAGGLNMPPHPKPVSCSVLPSGGELWATPSSGRLAALSSEAGIPTSDKATKKKRRSRRKAFVPNFEQLYEAITADL